MPRLRHNILIGEIIVTHPLAGLPLFDQAVASTAPRMVHTGDAERNESYRRTITQGLNEKQDRVLKAILYLRRASDKQVARHLNVPHHTIPPRRGELQQLGLVEKCGTTLDAETNRTVSLWKGR